jgi:hypothetical protein
MLTLLMAAATVFGLQTKTVSPIVAPIKFFYGDPIISISIDGKPPQEFGLTMTTRHSIVMQSEDAGAAKLLTINGKTLGTANLEAPGASVHPLLNALGLTVLNGMAIGVDYAKNEITFWPGGRIGADVAKAWILKAAKWDAESAVWSMPIQRRAEVAPVLPLMVGGKPAVMLLRLGQQGTSFARGEEPPSGVSVEYGPGGNQALLAHVGIGPATLPWILYFRGVSYDPRKAIDPSIVGTFTTENLLARRVILDLAANTMYVEQLSADEQVSMFLSEWFQMPINVQGSKMVLREMPATKFYPQLAPIYDSEILEIMGQPSQQLLNAARDATPEHVTYLKLLFERVWQGFRVKFKKPNGEVVEATLSPPKS